MVCAVGKRDVGLGVVQPVAKPVRHYAVENRAGGRKPVDNLDLGIGQVLGRLLGHIAHRTCNQRPRVGRCVANASTAGCALPA